MSILIRGMEMPKNCYECLVRNQGFSGDGMKCGKTGSVLSWRDGHRKRMDNCPLVPIPPHGRMIDADAVAKMVLDSVNQEDAQGFMFTKIICQILKDAPTIIPAEEVTK